MAYALRSHAQLRPITKRTLKLVNREDYEDHSDRPTDPAGSVPPVSAAAIEAQETAALARPEIPPNKPALIKTGAELMAMPGYDDNRFQDVVAVSLVEAFHESRAARAAFSPEVIEQLVERVKGEFDRSTSAGFDMLRGPITETLATVKELVPRVERIESRLEDGEKHFQANDRQLADLNQQMGGMRERLQALEAEVKTLKDQVKVLQDARATEAAAASAAG